MALPFIKMHGLGNDFVIFDARRKPLKFSAAQAKTIADRRTGVGCDQLIVLEGVRGQGAGVRKRILPTPDPRSPIPTAVMRIINADGGEVSACGNATRCVAWLLMEETGKKNITIETKAGIIACERAGKNAVRADMGKPVFDWKKIPIARECNVDALPILMSGLRPSAVSMGNPHMVFAVPHADKIPLEKIGAKLEKHPFYPKRANVSFAEVITKNRIVLRVWERGAGATLACGTAACAAVVALHKRGLISNKADVLLPGGALEIEWDKKSGRVFMTGPVAVSFEGEWHG